MKLVLPLVPVERYTGVRFGPTIKVTRRVAPSWDAHWRSVGDPRGVENTEVSFESKPGR
jgi:hypothetical protein